jgi:hypothetical protein
MPPFWRGWRPLAAGEPGLSLFAIRQSLAARLQLDHRTCALAGRPGCLATSETADRAPQPAIQGLMRNHDQVVNFFAQYPVALSLMAAMPVRCMRSSAISRLTASTTSGARRVMVICDGLGGYPIECPSSPRSIISSLDGSEGRVQCCLWACGRPVTDGLQPAAAGHNTGHSDVAKSANP